MTYSIQHCPSDVDGVRRSRTSVNGSVPRSRTLADRAPGSCLGMRTARRPRGGYEDESSRYASGRAQITVAAHRCSPVQNRTAADRSNGVCCSECFEMKSPEHAKDIKAPQKNGCREGVRSIDKS